MNLSSIVNNQAKQFIIGVLTFALLMVALPIKASIIAMLAVSLLTEIVGAVKNRTWMFNSLDIVFTLLGALCAYLITLI